jgi:hypothetical protein
MTPVILVAIDFSPAGVGLYLLYSWQRRELIRYFGEIISPVVLL